MEDLESALSSDCSSDQAKTTTVLSLFMEMVPSLWVRCVFADRPNHLQSASKKRMVAPKRPTQGLEKEVDLVVAILVENNSVLAPRCLPKTVPSIK